MTQSKSGFGLEYYLQKRNGRGDEEEIDFSNRARAASHDRSPRLLFYGAVASGE